MPHKLREWRDRLPCASVHKQRLSAYLDGELEQDARASLEKHLDACARCRAQYEELRFAARAMSHFVVPAARIPAWQPTARRAPQSTALERFWTMKLNVPAPLAVGLTLALVFCVAALLFLGRQQTIQTSVDPMPTASLSPQIKFVEVPVERERVVTRTIYAQARPSASRRDATRQTESVANRSPRATGRERELMTSTSLTGFRPATEANLRIVKEPEQ